MSKNTTTSVISSGVSIASRSALGGALRMLKTLVVPMLVALTFAACSTFVPLPEPARLSIDQPDPPPLAPIPASYDTEVLAPTEYLRIAAESPAIQLPSYDFAMPYPASHADDRVFLIATDPKLRLSPYAQERRRVVDRVIVRFANGQWAFTKLALANPSSTVESAMFLAPSHISLGPTRRPGDNNLPHFRVDSNGIAASSPVDPLLVLASGYSVVARTNVSEGSDSFVIPPRFDNLYGWNGDAQRKGEDGANGYRGSNGSDGSNGIDGRNGDRGRAPYSSHSSWNHQSHSLNGGHGQSGGHGSNGRDGLPGGDGANGSKGGDAIPLKIVVKPLESEFHEQVLMRIEIYDAGTGAEINTLLIEWGREFVVSARGAAGGRGGNGGMGGRGGNGGNGGAGGDGGEGANGLAGEKGADGRAGRPGRLLASTPQQANGKDGEDGCDGSRGGDGGDGGNGGNGGNAGDGGTGGRAGIGGRGGDGGNGADIELLIEGSAEFVAMVRRAISFDVSGGAEGEGGRGGASGDGGKAGRGGEAGSGGRGGRGGEGGRSGSGGAGGRAGTYVAGGAGGVRVTLPGRDGRRGSSGRHGFAGSSGSGGNGGQSGHDGRSGSGGERGRDGASGTPGAKGRVVVTVVGG